MKCEMCGKLSVKLVNRWYKYDNGEQFISAVCNSCSKLHGKLVKVGA